LDRIDLEFWTAKEVARLLALIENEKRYYQEIIAILPTPLAVISREQNLVAVNRAFRHLFGSGAGESGARGLRDISPDPTFVAKLVEAIESGTAATGIPALVQPAEGTPRAVNLSVIPIEDWFHESGREALLVVEDPAKETVPGPEIADPVPGVVWRLDYGTKQTRFYTADPERLLAATEISAWDRRVHPDDEQRVAAVYDAVAASRNPAAVEYRAVREDGVEIVLCDQIRAVQDSPDAGSLLVVTTVETNRRENTGRHIQRQEVDALARLARPLAHDFNNQLMVILGYTEEIEQSFAKADERRPGLEEIRKAVERLRTITMHLLAFGRPPSPRPKELELNVFLRGMALPVGLRLSREDAVISADSLQLDQALRKLVGFFVERSKTNRVVLETTRRRNYSDYGEGLPPGEFVTLAIGPAEGLTSQQLAAWTEPFVVEGGKPPQMGLAPEIMLLRQIGAWITPVAVKGGAALEILFPLAQTPEVPMQPEVETAPPEPPAPREVILVAEDEESIRSLVARVLAKQGYRVLEAADGEDALRQAAEFPGDINLVLTDVMLPQIRGTELVKRLRLTRPGIHALYVSGYSDDPELTPGNVPPTDGFLQKPFQLGVLVDTVKTLLGTRE
jgi:CheY-like chemotaxis protein/nitrogen-specific signal transduction histidine kinase